MLSWIKDTRIAIWGYGQEGRAAHKYLLACGGYKELFVLTPEPEEVEEGAQNLYGPRAMDILRAGEFDVVIKSPGISLYDPVIAAAKDNGSKFTSTTNMWFETYPDAKTIVITGTKGKSTTASMLHHILNGAGYDTALGGNIGMPLLGVDPAKDYTVIELSSYQLADLQNKPDIFVILNLYPEHVPWHGDVESYYGDKLSPIFKADKPVIIANRHNATLYDYLKDEKTAHWYGEEDIAEDIKLPVKGAHNRSNFAAICAVCKQIGLEDSPADLLNGYAVLPHRMQELQMDGSALYVNDSISTTPQSTLEAVKTYSDRNMILIMGGTDRGQDYYNFASSIRDLPVKHVFILPGHAKRLCDALHDHTNGKIAYSEVADLQTAMEQIAAMREKNDVILLSPAAPSFTQFKNFEERGNLFMELARKAG